MSLSAKFDCEARSKLSGGDEGTIMVDALVAVVIISLMIAMCTTAMGLAGRAGRHARETRQAQATLAALVATTPRIAGRYAGVRDGFHYAVTVEEQKTPLSRFCVLHARVTGTRAYQLDAARWCNGIGAAG